ncbi:MAG: virulence protein RhuM/Fic/DOC family protein [Coriobacteriia bacterium]|nr:virulence protein RhuM/Fic/DOC family protein [Coriobacteriia bacterium]
MKSKNELVLFQSQDGEVSLPVSVDIDKDDIWLNRDQISKLYGRDIKTIGKHVNNVLNEELAGSADAVVAKFATTASDGKTYQVEHYNLDVVISVGYRVKSKRGIEFRRWATDVLRRYIMQGHAENEKRLAQLAEITRIIERLPGSLESGQILDIVRSYTGALDLLDDYDHQSLGRPEGSKATYVLSYEECRNLIESMRFSSESELFGNEKDDSFESSISAIYQSFDGQDLYPSAQEKAANLLYFVVKNHSFSDGNKRIAAALFLYFLDKNGLLYSDGQKMFDDYTLVAVTIMIAESRPEEKETMVSLVMNFLA